MEHKEAIKESRQRKLVDDDKFERHFRKAIKQDIDSLKKIFTNQTEFGHNKRTRTVVC